MRRMEGGVVICPVDNQEAEENNEGHGKKDGTIIDIFPQTKFTNKLKNLLLYFFHMNGFVMCDCE